MSWLHVLVLAGFAGCFLSFVWAMSGPFFRTVDRVPAGTRLIQVVGGAFAAVHVWVLLRSEDTGGLLMFSGLGLYALAFGLFWSSIWANWRQPLSLAFSSDQPRHLVQHGPYRFVRHPFYTSYSLAWLAGAVAGGQPLLAFTVIAMGAIYLSAARMEEHKFLISPIAAEFVSYRRQTGMFFPRVLGNRRMSQHNAPS